VLSLYSYWNRSRAVEVPMNLKKPSNTQMKLRVAEFLRDFIKICFMLSLTFDNCCTCCLLKVWLLEDKYRSRSCFSLFDKFIFFTPRSLEDMTLSDLSLFTKSFT